MDEATRSRLLATIESRRDELRRVHRFVVWRAGWLRYFVVDQETSKLSGPYWTAWGARKQIDYPKVGRFE